MNLFHVLHSTLRLRTEDRLPRHTCQHPCEGHQVAATNENMMGGNNTIRRQPGQPAHPPAQRRINCRRNPPGPAQGPPAPPRGGGSLLLLALPFNLVPLN